MAEGYGNWNDGCARQLHCTVVRGNTGVTRVRLRAIGGSGEGTGE